MATSPSTPPETFRPAPATAAEATPGEPPMTYLLFATAVASLGGFLFGYDTAVISGAIEYLRLHFGLSDAQTGWAGASAIIGCIPGAMAAGFLSDRLGRRNALVICAVLYAVSAITSAIPRTLAEFIVARFVGGLGVGASSMICSVYIAEIAPEKHRGRLGSLFQLGIVVGILVVFFVNMLIQRAGDEAWNTTAGWRWMLGSETFPALLFLGCLFFVPESPRWLILRGEVDRARRILLRFRSAEAAEAEIAAVQEVARDDEGRLGELLTPAFRRPLVIAVGLAAFAQFSGINAIMYYAPVVFKAAGASADSAFASAVWVGAVNLLFTFVAIAFVDRLGRKPLLLIGTAVQTVALAAVAWLYHTGHQGVLMLLCVMSFTAAFAIAMGPIPWIVISEIFPGRIRGRAASVGVLVIWASCYVVAQTFPMLQGSIGMAATFALYGACSLASLVFVLLVVPETKGLTLEQIEASWRQR